MDEETNLEPQAEQTKTGPSKEYTTVLLVLAFALVVVFALVLSGAISPIRDGSESSIMEKETSFRQSSPSLNGTGNELEHVLPQEFSGTVVHIAPDGTYIKLLIPNVGTYSIGLTTETKITKNGESTDIFSAELRYPVTIYAKELSDTEMYDYLALSVTLGSGENETREERQARLEFFDSIYTGTGRTMNE